MAYNKGSRKVYKGHKFASRVQTTKKAKNRDSEKKRHQFLNRVNLQSLGSYTRASLVNWWLMAILTTLLVNEICIAMRGLKVSTVVCWVIIIHGTISRVDFISVRLENLTCSAISHPYTINTHPCQHKEPPDQLPTNRSPSPEWWMRWFWHFWQCSFSSYCCITSYGLCRWWCINHMVIFSIT